MILDNCGEINRANVGSISIVAKTRPWASPLVLAIIFFAAGIACHREQSTIHSISGTFDYDFTVNHGCSPTLRNDCIARFNVYDVSTARPTKLFTIPAPSGASGQVKDIIGKSQPLKIEAGKHLLAISAQMSSGEESSLQPCATWMLLP